MFGSDLGVQIDGDVVRVAVWAPAAATVQFSYLKGPSFWLTPDGSGRWHGTGPAHAAAYVLVVDGKEVLDPYARRVEMSKNRPVGHLTLPSPLESAKPHVPWNQTVIYEAHVRGLTMLNPAVPASLRGTYLGACHESVIDHLLTLGVTTIELMPVQAFMTEPALAQRGFTNYWGYNPVAYFAPHPGYATSPGTQNDDFREMVTAFHAAGLEVIIDVVYNHTAEGDRDGPDLHLRTLDEEGYYLSRDGEYANLSGCGNTLRSDSPAVRDLTLSSLRHWAHEYGVDGFRFDLAGVLIRASTGRQSYASSLLEAIADDAVLGALKLIAEPWDATGDGYCLGAIGDRFAQLNDRFRDDIRDYWRCAGSVANLATRLAGSSDLFTAPTASINFVTAHDGFTLRDLVSYNASDNSANGENNGHGDNRSDNSGHEGETTDAAIINSRQSRARNLLSTLLLSQGVPLLRMGDEFGHTQRGNNNAYCQDNPISWIDWSPDQGWDLREHIASLNSIRRAFPHVSRSTFLTDADVDWTTRTDTPMTSTDWETNRLTFLGMTMGQLTMGFDAVAGHFDLVCADSGDSSPRQLIRPHP